MTRSPLNEILAGVALVLSAGSSCLAQERQPDFAALKAEALQWLDRLAVDEVLIHPDDLQELRSQVAAKSPEDAAAWWGQFAIQRELFDRPQWRETREWWRRHLKVQASYSDEEIRCFQSGAYAKALASPRALREVMDELAAERRSLKAAGQMFEETRRALVESARADLDSQRRMHEIVLQLPAQPHKTAAPTIAHQRPARYYPAYPPLIDSLSVARWAVFREIFPRW